jgi:hypothetical protein
VLVELPQAQALHQAARHQLGADASDERAEAEPLRGGRAPRADARVEDHKPFDPVGMLHREAKPDRSTPVVYDDRQPAKLKF